MMNLIDNTQVQLKGHSSPVKSLAFDPKGEFLASADCSGNIKIWNCKFMACIETLSVLENTLLETYEALCCSVRALKLVRVLSLTLSFLQVGDDVPHTVAPGGQIPRDGRQQE
jgi:WD40 repeat protein